MAAKNTSDHIEDYLKNLLAQTGVAVVKRADLADVFQVVPSQINYVLKTRFTESRGYLVESKRGGGGYVRIMRLTLSEQHDLLCRLMATIDNQLSEQVFSDVLDYLTGEAVMTQREAQLIFSLATDDLLGLQAPNLRAKMVYRLLQRLDRKG